MPVYEYECEACHRVFEYQQRMSDPDKTVCEACGGALDRLISRTAFQLKGGGWYKDLYASSKPSGGDSGGGDGGVKPTPVESIKASEGAPSGDGSPKSSSSEGGGGTSSSSSSDKKPSSSGAGAS